MPPASSALEAWEVAVTNLWAELDQLEDEEVQRRAGHVIPPSTFEAFHARIMAFISERNERDAEAMLAGLKAVPEETLPGFVAGVEAIRSFTEWLDLLKSEAMRAQEGAASSLAMEVGYNGSFMAFDLGFVEDPDVVPHRVAERWNALVDGGLLPSSYRAIKVTQS